VSPRPARLAFLPYGRQLIDDADVRAVVETLRSDWLTTGPKVDEFEQGIAGATGSAHAVAVSNGTAALHASMAAIGVAPGDEVIVPALTFVATANAAVYQGGTPVFADVLPESLLVDPADVERRLTPCTKAIVTVDFGGQPCHYNELRELARSAGVPLVADACHALGATYRDRPVGTLADLTTLSFHPVKHITTAEGGMVTTDDAELATRLRRFRNHGLSSDHRERHAAGSWRYEMLELGFNYRLSDLQCALGIAQLRHLPEWVARRREIAALYTAALADVAGGRPLAVEPDRVSSWHLYVVQLELEQLRGTRDDVFRAMRGRNIGVNVHYIPVPHHPYYRERARGGWTAAEHAYERILSLPMFPAMTDEDVADVVAALEQSLAALRR
jgi:perosamine synthetase